MHYTTPPRVYHRSVYNLKHHTWERLVGGVPSVNTWEGLYVAGV